VTGNDVRVGPQGGFQALSYPSRTFTVNTSTDTLTTSTNHGLAINDPVYVSSTTTLPSPLAANTVYFVKTVPTTTTLTLSATAGGATIDLTTTGTGTHSILYVKPDPYLGNYCTLTLTQNTTIPNPSQQHQNQRLSFQFTQDGTGGRALTWGNKFLIRKWSPNTGASKANTIDFVFDGTNWIQIGGTNEGFGDAGVLDRVGAGAGITTEGSDQTIYSVTVPGDLLGANGGLRCRVFGTWSHASGTARTPTFKINFGSTTMYADATASLTTGSDRAVVFDFYIQNLAATNSQQLGGVINISAANAATTGTGDLGAVGTVIAPILGTATEDTTAAKTLTVAININAATGVDPTFTRRMAITEFLN